MADATCDGAKSCEVVGELTERIIMFEGEVFRWKNRAIAAEYALKRSEREHAKTLDAARGWKNTARWFRRLERLARFVDLSHGVPLTVFAEAYAETRAETASEPRQAFKVAPHEL